MAIKNIDTAVANRIYNELSSLLYDLESGTLTSLYLLDYIAEILMDANVNSKCVVDILEKFGDIGNEIATGIKIREGW